MSEVTILIIIQNFHCPIILPPFYMYCSKARMALRQFWLPLVISQIHQTVCMGYLKYQIKGVYHPIQLISHVAPINSIRLMIIGSQNRVSVTLALAVFNQICLTWRLRGKWWNSFACHFVSSHLFKYVLKAVSTFIKSSSGKAKALLLLSMEVRRPKSFHIISLVLRQISSLPDCHVYLPWTLPFDKSCFFLNPNRFFFIYTHDSRNIAFTWLHFVCKIKTRHQPCRCNVGNCRY